MKKLSFLLVVGLSLGACAQSPHAMLAGVGMEERKGRITSADSALNFEKYNVGHLMTAACAHYRATGKKTLLAVATRAADYLMIVYQHSSPESARDAICPSHYMGLVELSRVTKNPAYLRLAKNLIDVRGFVGKGTDDNQDRAPFRSQNVAMGHAVRANYLYAGVADVVAEMGDDSLRRCLDAIWDDVTERKMYVTGGCGALYDGVSPDGVSYNPAAIQEVHQAYFSLFVALVGWQGGVYRSFELLPAQPCAHACGGGRLCVLRQWERGVCKPVWRERPKD